MQNKRFGVFSSSEDPNKLGDRAKGIILGASTLIIFCAHYFFGINIFAEDISQFASGVGAAISSLWFLYGLIKSLLVKYYVRKG